MLSRQNLCHMLQPNTRIQNVSALCGNAPIQKWKLMPRKNNGTDSTRKCKHISNTNKHTTKIPTYTDIAYS
jgi:hypothetical protein